MSEGGEQSVDFGLDLNSNCVNMLLFLLSVYVLGK